MESGTKTIHADLIRKCREGDRKSQSELFKLYSNAMYNICRRMMGDPDEAKDVLQDAFVDAFINFRSLKDDALFTAWIKKIVINKCLNTLKRKKLTEPLSEWESDHIQDQVEEQTDEMVYDVKRVVRAMDNISEGCRTVVNLYLFEGYDHKEIAGILSISESASKAQYSKGKAKIRKLLATEQST